VRYEWTGLPNSKFEKAMEIEHCFKFGCDFTFETGNYGITTTPAKEWAVVVLNVQAESMGNGRRIRTLEDCMQLQLVKDAQLIRSEVIAVILYTGPMVSPSLPRIKKSHLLSAISSSHTESFASSSRSTTACCASILLIDSKCSERVATSSLLR
jgi:hypothetical protein